MTTTRRSLSYKPLVDNGVSEYRVVSGTSFPKGVDIDGFLSEEDTRVLYERWKGDLWGEPLVFSGGTKSITCEMVLEVPSKDLIKTYGAALANRLVAASERGSR